MPELLSDEEYASMSPNSSSYLNGHGASLLGQRTQRSTNRDLFYQMETSERQMKNDVFGQTYGLDKMVSG